MTEWQERIDRETPPAIRAEHELRYRVVAPLIRASGVWADLGCGNGVAPARVLSDASPDRVILLDVDRAAVETAARELALSDAVLMTGDLVDPQILQQVGEALLAAPSPRVVTCFEVVEHLENFVPLLEWARGLADEGETTFVLSVPNDALWSIENPFHAAQWGEGAFEELCRLLPAEQSIRHQVAITGSAMSRMSGPARELTVPLEIMPGLAPSHFVVSFGPRHAELEDKAAAVAHDQREQRRWERQRESNLMFAEALSAARAGEIEQLDRDLRRLVAERDEWRAYIHELERELGRPLSGSGAADLSG